MEAQGEEEQSNDRGSIGREREIERGREQSNGKTDGEFENRESERT